MDKLGVFLCTGCGIGDAVDIEAVTEAAKDGPQSHRRPTRACAPPRASRPFADAVADDRPQRRARRRLLGAGQDRGVQLAHQRLHSARSAGRPARALRLVAAAGDEDTPHAGRGPAPHGPRPAQEDQGRRAPRPRRSTTPCWSSAAAAPASLRLRPRPRAPGGAGRGATASAATWPAQGFRASGGAALRPPARQPRARPDRRRSRPTRASSGPHQHPDLRDRRPARPVRGDPRDVPPEPRPSRSARSSRPPAPGPTTPAGWPPRLRRLAGRGHLAGARGHAGASGSLSAPPTARRPERVVFVQCAGSRDPEHLPYCSSECCATSLKQVAAIHRDFPEVETAVVYRDMRTPGQLEHFYPGVQEQPRASCPAARSSRGSRANGNLRVTLSDSLLGEARSLDGRPGRAGHRHGAQLGRRRGDPRPARRPTTRPRPRTSSTGPGAEAAEDRRAARRPRGHRDPQPELPPGTGPAGARATASPTRTSSASRTRPGAPASTPPAPCARRWTRPRPPRTAGARR